MRYTPGKVEDFITNIKYTNGKEYMYLDGVEYIGHYHIYKNITFTGTTHDKQSVQLMLYTNDKLILEYIQLKNTKQFEPPITFHITPTIKDYKTGNIKRYFISKRNEDSIVYEVNEEKYNTLTVKNKGLNGDIYKGVILNWKLTGPVYDVYTNDILTQHGIYNTNEREAITKSKTLPGLLKYINKNYTDYSKNY